jgi:hypothetical protein
LGESGYPISPEGAKDTSRRARTSALFCLTAIMKSTEVVASISGDEAKPLSDDEILRIRETLAKSIVSNAKEILEGALKRAKEGHYCLTKLLFALAGIYPVPPTANEALDRSLADFFCKELGLPDPEQENDPAPAADREHSLK